MTFPHLYVIPESQWTEWRSRRGGDPIHLLNIPRVFSGHLLDGRHSAGHWNRGVSAFLAYNPVVDTNIPPRIPTVELKLQPWQELKKEMLVPKKACDRKMSPMQKGLDNQLHLW